LYILHFKLYQLVKKALVCRTTSNTQVAESSNYAAEADVNIQDVDSGSFHECAEGFETDSPIISDSGGSS